MIDFKDTDQEIVSNNQLDDKPIYRMRENKDEMVQLDKRQIGQHQMVAMIGVSDRCIDSTHQLKFVSPRAVGLPSKIYKGVSKKN